MLFPKNKKPSGVAGGFLNANWAVPVLAAFMARPQSELKSARLKCFQRRRQYPAPRQMSIEEVLPGGTGFGGEVLLN
jgi:hypothetical protein